MKPPLIILFFTDRRGNIILQRKKRVKQSKLTLPEYGNWRRVIEDPQQQQEILERFQAELGDRLKKVVLSLLLIKLWLTFKKHKGDKKKKYYDENKSAQLVS